MSTTNDRCKQLRKLHDHLVNEMRILKENVSEEEQEGVENPLETVNIIKSLQEALHSIDLELQKCPPGD